jgi:hypothetical protein
VTSAYSTEWRVSIWLSYLRKRGCLVVLAVLLSACLPSEAQLKPDYRIDYMLGAYDPTAVSIWTNDKGFDWEEYLSDLAEHHLNFTQVRLVVDPRVKFDYPAQYGNARGPWPITPEGAYDYGGWDDVFWNRLDTFLTRAKELGLTVEVSVLGRETDDLIPIAQRHAYMDKVVEEVAAHDNVVLELCNECGYEGDLQHLYDVVEGRLPIAIDDDNTRLQGQDDPRVSRVNFHHCNSGPDLDVELNYYRGSKPVTQDEDCRGWQPDWPGPQSRSSPPSGTVYDPDYNREVAWRSFTGGAHNLHIDWWMWRGTGDYGTGQPSSAPEQTLDYFQYLVDFLTENEIQFAELSPMRSPYSPADGDLLVEYPGTAYVTAKESAMYVVYFVGEGQRRDVVVNLTMDRARYRWFDPARGEYVSEGTITGGEGVRISCPEFEHDIVLLLVRVD